MAKPISKLRKYKYWFCWKGMKRGGKMRKFKEMEQKLKMTKHNEI